MMPAVYDQLVGVCHGASHDATEWRREDGDVFGMLLGHDHQGWWLVAEHVSSDPSFSKGDIGHRRAEHDPGLRLPYTWAGWLTHDDLAERFPPAWCKACDSPPHDNELCPALGVDQWGG